jgi:hypothetical protein
MTYESLRYADPEHSTILTTKRRSSNFRFQLHPATGLRRDRRTRVADVRAYTPPAITWADIRSKRDGLLAETDWVVVKAQEVGEAVPAAWVTYRQALRDLPANTADPANPVWPSAP